MTIVIDIETGPLPEEQLAGMKPAFEAARNLKDPDKIAASIAEKEAAWFDRAALDAKTARVLVIGTMIGGRFDFICGGENEKETALLTDFWRDWNEGHKFVGFCIRHFDFPMLIRRSLILGVKARVDDVMNGRYLSGRIIDLQELWCLYSRDTAGESLDAVCKAFGLPGKNGDGKDFAKLWAEDRKAALDYLRNDCEQTYELAKRMGVIEA